ncbi:hypothetical protein ACH9L7_19990 (plasmid) [Haloferax sp. S1W]|uniref:hypothetical protein n=1 Tax=Haloferax sp. S1W TaxID=3377110 RepID=UPI0037C933E6
MAISPVILQSNVGTILTGIIAAVAVLGAIASVVVYIHRWRWKGVESAREKEEYLRQQLVDAIYAGGPMTGTVTSIKVREDSGILYRMKKAVFASVSGSTELTMRFDHAAISDDRLDQEPFATLFSDPSQVDLVDAEHMQTQPNPAQGHTLVQIRVFSMDYDDVGGWCAGLPKMIWDAIERMQTM